LVSGQSPAYVSESPTTSRPAVLSPLLLDDVAGRNFPPLGLICQPQQQHHLGLGHAYLLRSSPIRRWNVAIPETKRASAGHIPVAQTSSRPPSRQWRRTVLISSLVAGVGPQSMARYSGEQQFNQIL
ncbi:MAG: hypothetical protein WCF80_24950, partial [Pseudolabrys sp.]